MRDPTEFCVKFNKAFPIRQDLGQVNNLKGSVFYGKDVKRVVEGICEQPAFYEHSGHHEQHEGAVQQRASDGDGGGA